MKVKCPIGGCRYQTDEIDNGAVLAAILNLHAQSHATGAATIEKMRRPTVSPGTSAQDWEFFQRRWNSYKTGAELTGARVVSQLLECCSEDLLKDLMQTSGNDLSSKTETEVMKMMKELAVVKENLLVARHRLHNMQQNAGEPIRTFAARIKGQANIQKDGKKQELSLRYVSMINTSYVLTDLAE